jgi:phosphoglucosamine mutase
MKRLFGTDGMRGKAGLFPLDPQTVRNVGASLATHLNETLGRAPNLVIGRDTRESGDWLEEALINGAADAGAHIQSAGVISTPGVAYLARVLPADAGIVISASHNEYKDNGIKIFAPSGRKIDEETERLIECDIYSWIDKPDRKTSHQTALIQQDEALILRQRYFDFLELEIAAGLSLSGLTIVVDCANGAAFNVAPVVLQKLGASVIAINWNPDGTNINRDCGSLHIEALQRMVSAEHANLGIAFDGDADRSLFVDEAGNFVDGDATLWVLANYLNDRGGLANSTVVATVMSNIGLEIALRSKGLKLVRTDVGDKYVLEELLRSGATLGGEQSGHVIFPKLSLAGDGMITSLCLLRAMRDEKKTLRQLTQGMVRYPQILVNVPVREKRPFEELGSLNEHVKKVESGLGNKGRLLLRYSGTELLARIMIEGESQSEIEQYADEIAETIRNEIGS